ncbi:MAG: threonylcarbamoyl-AMP synthase [bacterium (Candidatus Stahlbacteria) CG08_land_8_20_14_0_20_40_26]|nr:MAG: threonylcarbamoyl-AMP synthase [bacterium (Candidatus Stahlbacteria) CG23_combo_of_CG06-09_8_20_14_all_40_9]PIS25452.1 MAG: threonylcarbamoyl-AMP synthase [bacterium (Candidatus Stahlbacteria) CG08_land_8_20_14_0_20_40_26]
MKWLNRAINTLRDGGVIAFPTDTVYGIGCDATNKEAIEKIYRIKHRKRNKPLIMFIPSPNHLETITPRVTKLVFQLSQYFWPGPLTLVVKAKQDIPFTAENGTVGIRIPDEKHILILLRNYPNPLVTTSCNIEGLPVLSNAKEIKRVFGNNIDYIIGGNPPKSQIPSTVLRVSPPTLLRKGKVSIFEIEKKIGHKVMLPHGTKIGILFVCAANVCRSPMAVGLARTIAPQTIYTNSAGIFATQNSPPSFFAKSVMHEIGIEIRTELSKQITKDIVYDYDLILCMEEAQKEWIISNYPDIEGRVFLLGEFGKNEKTEEIEDPVGKGIEDYRKCRDILKKEIQRVSKYLKDRYYE